MELVALAVEAEELSSLMHPILLSSSQVVAVVQQMTSVQPQRLTDKPQPVVRQTPTALSPVALLVVVLMEVRGPEAVQDLRVMVGNHLPVLVIRGMHFRSSMVELVAQLRKELLVALVVVVEHTVIPAVVVAAEVTPVELPDRTTRQRITVVVADHLSQREQQISLPQTDHMQVVRPVLQTSIAITEHMHHQQFRMDISQLLISMPSQYK
jgi:hypothetical protein